MNRKRERFKAFEDESRLNRDDVIINLIINKSLNIYIYIYIYIKFIKLAKLTIYLYM